MLFLHLRTISFFSLLPWAFFQSRPSHRLHIHSFSERFRNHHIHFDLNSPTLRDGQKPAHLCPTLFTFDSPCRCAWPFSVDKHVPRQKLLQYQMSELVQRAAKALPDKVSDLLCNKSCFISSCVVLLYSSNTSLST